MSTDELLSWVRQNIVALNKEHADKYEKVRASSAKRPSWDLIKQSMIIKVIKEINRRLEFQPDSVHPSQFMILLRAKKINPGVKPHQQFRLVRHYDPATLRYIESRFLDTEEKDTSVLIDIAVEYGSLSQEQAMVYINADFFTALFDKLAAPARVA